MTAYHIALLLHLLALLAATATSALVHLAVHRSAAEPSLRQAMTWARLASRTAKGFPPAILVLVLTGAYMVSGQWSWHLGWVQAGLAGALALPVMGAVMGRRAAAQARANAARLQAAGGDLTNDGPVDRVAAGLLNANTYLAVGIVLIMTMKPGLAASVALLVLAAVAGAVWGGRRAGVATAAQEPA